MRIPRVLFVIPPTVEKLGNIRPSPAIGYLSEYLESNGVSTRVVDLSLVYNNDVDQLYEKLLKREIDNFRPHLIGYSMFSFKYRYTYSVISKVKNKHPDILSVAGGPHISTWREKALEECEGIDFGVVLEGEKTLLELCRKGSGEGILGLIYRGNDGRVVYNGDRPFIEELDEVPFPKFGRFNLKQYITEKTIFTSRGCPYRCSFCPVHSVIGRQMRFRSAVNVGEELAYWYSKGIRRFDFQDDNFTLVKERVYEICDEIDRRRLKGLFIRCSNGIRADKTDPALMKRMWNVGFRSVGIGVESVSDAALKEMQKAVSVNRIEEAIKDLCKLNFDVHLFFLVGMPKETEDDLKRSEQFALKYPILKVNFYNPIPYPGTSLFEYLNRENLFLKNYKEYLNDVSNYSEEPLFVTPELSRDTRINWLKRLKAVEKEVMRRSFRSRMGYLGKILSDVGSRIFVTEPVQKMLFNNKYIRNLADFLRYIYIRKEKS